MSFCHNLYPIPDKCTLNGLPDGVGPRTKDIAATDVIVLNHLRLSDDLTVPLTEVLLFGDLQTQSGGKGGGGDYNIFAIFTLSLIRNSHTIHTQGYTVYH